MYSILIVDDERFMRQGIAKLLPWNLLNIDRVETAESGAKALAKMEAHMPDLVLTDIEMDNMNGLQLIKKMNQMNPMLRIIVLTGHDDFSYVQECCRMEVQDYLLKPVDSEKLIEAIGGQVDALDRLLAEQAKKKTIDRVNALAEQMRVERLFHDFLKTGAGEGDIRQVLEEYGCRPGDSFQAAMLLSDGTAKNEWSSQHELLDLSINSVCVELVEYNGNGITFRDENNALILLLFRGKGRPNSRELLEQIQSVLQNEYDAAQRVYLGSVVRDVRHIPDSYRDTVELWTSSRQSGGIFQAGAEATTAEAAEQLRQRTLRALQAELESPEQALECWDAYCQDLSGSDATADLVRQSSLRLLTDIYLYWLRETGGAPGQALLDLISRMNGSASPEEMHQVGYDFLERLLSGQKPGNDNVIASAKRYIAGHLDESLSVTQLAERFYLSVAYFSKLFKKTEGVGCNYYIVRQRMERAKQLLTQQQARMGEIAEQVGYRDVNYFSLTFKKYTGLSPAEFREQQI